MLYVLLKMLMKHALLPSGREIEARDLCYGSIRSNDYKCLFCKKIVTFVSDSERADAHFRHKVDESCISSCKHKERIEEIAELRTSNRKTDFHRWWQSLFNERNTEVRFEANNCVHIADIAIQANVQINLDDGNNMFSYVKRELVIEVQHSKIAAEDVKSRVTCYNTDSCNLLWIVDISHIEHHVDHVITMTQDIYKIIFTKQHSGLSNILKNQESSVVLFDNGSYLYQVTRCYLDEGHTYVSPLSKTSFLSQLRKYADITIPNSIMESNNCNTRNYKSFLESMKLCVQVDVDDIINMMEDIPITKLRESHQLYASRSYESFIQMVVEWLAIVSKGDTSTIKMIKIWIDHLKAKYYTHDTIQFGKHKGSKICDIPQTYIKWVLENNVFKSNPDFDTKLLELRHMDLWFIKQWFSNPNSMHHFNRCREYYCYNWDDRCYKNREKMKNSLLERPWLEHFKEAILDCDGMVRSSEYEPLEFLNDSECSLYRENSDDEESYMYAYYPVKYKDKYIALNEDDLLLHYWEFDIEYGYHTFDKNCNPKVCLNGYAFLDE